MQERWPNHVILRSSLIYGPQAPSPVGRALFLQFIDASLAASKPTTFFEDEFRCPVYVADILAAVRRLLQLDADALPARLFNMGGACTACASRMPPLCAAMRPPLKQSCRHCCLNAHTSAVVPSYPCQSGGRPTGPERLSRVDMAAAVAALRGYDAALILPAPSASVQRGVASPADISMDTALLRAALGVQLTPFAAALVQIGFSGPPPPP